MKETKFVRCALASACSMFVAMLAGPVMAEGDFGETKALIEINATDGDVGFHALLDADGWKWAKITDPNGVKIFQEKPHGPLREQGLTENFFESAEPVCDPDDVEDPDEPVVSLAEFIARFPAGTYQYRAKTLDSELLKDTAELTYDLPAAPDIELSEEAAFEFDSAMPESTPVILMWEPGDDLGDKCHDQDLIDMGMISDPADVEVVGYEIVVEPADDEALVPNRKFTAQLRGDQDTLTISPEYLATVWDQMAEDGVLWVKFEIGAIEESHNQTFSEGEFCLYENDEADCVVEE